MINCPKAVQMIKKHPKMMARIIKKTQGKQTLKYWHTMCKQKPTNAMGYLVWDLIKVNRNLL